jgi:5'-nucleotidase
MLGVPGVALSFTGHHPETLLTYRETLVRLVRQITSAPDFPRATLLNINLPDLPATDVRGVRVTRLGSRYFSDSLTRMQDPWGRDIMWIGGGTITWTGGEDSDHAAVLAGYISVTPLQMDLTNFGLIEAVQRWNLS